MAPIQPKPNPDDLRGPRLAPRRAPMLSAQARPTVDRHAAFEASAAYLRPPLPGIVGPTFIRRPVRGCSAFAAQTGFAVWYGQSGHRRPARGKAWCILGVRPSARQSCLSHGANVALHRSAGLDPREPIAPWIRTPALSLGAGKLHCRLLARASGRRGPLALGAQGRGTTNREYAE